jgi:hypothetical protein
MHHQHQQKHALAGQADLRDGRDRRQAHYRVGDGSGWCIPSISPRTTTRCPGGKLGKLGWWFGGMLPPAQRVVGLRQIDGMPYQSQGAKS